jgi:hypothetical protein
MAFGSHNRLIMSWPADRPSIFEVGTRHINRLQVTFPLGWKVESEGGSLWDVMCRLITLRKNMLPPPSVQFRTLYMEPTSSFEMFVPTYQTTRGYEHNLDTHCRQNFRCHAVNGVISVVLKHRDCIIRYTSESQTSSGHRPLCSINSSQVPLALSS